MGWLFNPEMQLKYKYKVLVVDGFRRCEQSNYHSGGSSVCMHAPLATLFTGQLPLST